VGHRRVSTLEARMRYAGHLRRRTPVFYESVLVAEQPDRDQAFFPKGAIAFFAAMLVFFSAVWLFFYALMIHRH
jgi:hypothetical protein